MIDFLFDTGWGFVICVLSICAVSVGIAVAVYWPIQSRNCAYASRQYQRATQWDFFAGCYIEFRGRFISLDKYQGYVTK